MKLETFINENKDVINNGDLVDLGVAINSYHYNYSELKTLSKLFKKLGVFNDLLISVNQEEGPIIAPKFICSKAIDSVFSPLPKNSNLVLSNCMLSEMAITAIRG